MITITDLYTYPVKSCAGLHYDALHLTDTGPEYDRNWVITDPDGMFYTQREHPKMALIHPRFGDDCLMLHAAGMPTLTVPLNLNDAPHQHVEVWRDTVQAGDAGDDAAKWLTEFLGIEARLFAMTDKTNRLTDQTYAEQQARYGFADAFPLLVISEESLADLNERLGARGKSPVPMTRFRPNIVVKGGKPFIEDEWHAFEISGVRFDVVKSCARCDVTTVDPATGQVPDPQEPLATLATFRRGGAGKVLFGQNAIHRGNLQITVGDEVRVVD